MAEKPSASSRQDPPPSSESRNGGPAPSPTPMSDQPFLLPGNEVGGTQYFPTSEVQQQMVVEYPGVTSQQEPPHSEGGSLACWSRDEGVVPTLHDSLSVPTLRDLCHLPVPNWYLLGLQLGISADELDVIERNYPRDNRMCKVKMFGAWLRVDTSASYEKLARALVTVGKRHIAEVMCTARGIPLTVLDDVPVAAVEPLSPTLTLPPEPAGCVARYAQSLKDRYKRMSTLPDGDWPPSLGRQYTRLALIERERELPGAELVATMERDYIHGNIDNIVKRKKAIQLPEVFLPTEDGGQQLKILMDGAPGVGKSTLSRKVCKDWASGKLLQQYNLVILLPLRRARIRDATSIEDLICVDDPDLKQQVVQHIQRSSGEHILLIVDGYDELSCEDRIQNSFFLDIVQEDVFSKFSVLVTSRPYASGYLQQLQSINRHVEVLGFTEEQIEHCIMENIPDKAQATELVQTLKERQDIASLCYIPLNCAILLYVYKMEQYTLPQSLMKLYEIFILNAMKRHASVTGNDSIIRRLHNLAEIPDSFQKNLNALSKLAYTSLVASKMVFSIKDIKATFPNCSDFHIDINLLGLMTVFKEFTSTGEELSYQFMHLTIQEFLGARWAASQLSADELLKFFQDHLREERYRMVLLFLAGLSQLNFPSTEYLFQDSLDFNSPSHINKASYFFFLAHLIYESQNFTLFHNLASAIVDAKLSAAWYSMSPFDSLVLAHFLAWCDCSLKSLDLSYCGLTSQSLEIMHRVNLEHHGTTQIEEVDLSYNPNVITNISLLSTLPMFAHTKVLKACGLQYPEGAPCVNDLLCLLNMRHLTTLDISEKLGNIFLSLHKFQCQNGNIESQNAAKIFGSLEHNTSLKKLDLSWNSQLAEGDSEAVGCAIERMLNVNTTLKVLHLCGCGLECALVTTVFRSLEHNTSLEELDLSWNSQLARGDSEAVSCAIERMLSANTTLKVLNLSGCKVTEKIVGHILTRVTKNTSLLKVDIDQCALYGSCAVSVLQQVSLCPILSRVHVDEVDVLGVGRVKMNGGDMSCVIGDTIPERCVEFFRALSNSSMKVSELNVKDLTDQTAEHFAVGLAEMKSFRVLKLNHLNPSSLKIKRITSAGAVSIFRSLEHNTSLEELDLSENSQLAEGDSEAVGCAIERMLNVSGTLKLLNLEGCNVTDPIVKHILTGLTKNTSLVTLNIKSPKLSGSCAVSLFQQKTTHPTLSITVAEVNVLGVGRVKMDSGTIWCVMGDLIPENCVEFFRALNDSGLKVSKLNVQDLTDQTAEHFAVGLAESQSVHALKLEHCNISSAGAVCIFRSLEHNSSLEELDLPESWQLAEHDSEAVGCAIERLLNVNRTLKVLNLSKRRLDTTVIIHTAAGLAHNVSLAELNTGDYTVWNRNNITSEGWVHLFKALCNNTSLKKLDISGNKLGVKGSEALADTLSCNKSLTELNLHSCDIPEAGLTEILAKRLLHNTSLKKLNISYNNLGMEESVALADMLSCNKSLTELNLHSCNIPEAGLREIARGLLHNTSLKMLDISSNKIGVKGSEALAEMLSCNKLLTEMDLHSCNIPEAGLTEILAKGLLHNTSLKKLNISGNNLGMEGSVALADTLSCNKSLTELNLRWCDIPEAGLIEIARGLLTNTSLQTIVIGFTRDKTFLEAEIERLKKSGNFKSQSLRKIEIK